MASAALLLLAAQASGADLELLEFLGGDDAAISRTAPEATGAVQPLNERGQTPRPRNESDDDEDDDPLES